MGDMADMVNDDTPGEDDERQDRTLCIDIYEPLGWQKKVGYTVSPYRCAASVHDSHIGFRQCGNKGTRDVDGHSLCAKHAKMARRA